MDSPPPPISDAPPQQEADAKRDEREKEMVHKTKVIQFLGRTTPIILQNDNGPCPLLAICNVLSLKNSLNLSPDVPEVSQEKLLSLVAEHLIDSNSNIDNKDAGYVENQQQNIADAIDLLPRLTTGIDVNIKFRRIDDFEFTRECAIFDLLDIPLYHGWIVDPQDRETADAIGSKSYNTLVGELVSLETRTMESEQEKNPEDDNVDFVAATTAALGVPSPCLSRGHSFNDSPSSARKGDIEEEAELLRALKLSEEESSVADDVVSGIDLVRSADIKKSEPLALSSGSVPDGVVAGIDLVESAYMKKSEPVTLSGSVEKKVTNETVNSEVLIPNDGNISSNQNVDPKPTEVFTQEAVTLFPKTDSESRKCCNSAVGSTGSDAHIENEIVQPLSIGADSPSASNNSQDKSRSDECGQTEVTSTSDLVELRNHPNDDKARDSSSLLTTAAGIESSSDQVNNIGKPEAFTSSADGSEPIYEGEECIKESGNVGYENREPVYEGEVLLAEQVDKADDGDSKGRLSVRQGELIKNFLKSSASQLTVYGLFLLLENVKNRELCVFFRNNHFNTMFKHEGSLYILATDQGYINQPDLVWEKLNEVNGDTVYMTGNFKEFKMDDPSNGSWDEQNAMANTADYLATMDNAAQSHSSFNSDLQLAIALQQQEFDQQQQQQHPQRNLEPPATTGGSRLVTGPQVSQNSGKYKPSSSSSKQESKSKEKCIVM